jgi:hypothetical protein
LHCQLPLWDEVISWVSHYYLKFSVDLNENDEWLMT